MFCKNCGFGSATPVPLDLFSQVMKGGMDTNNPVFLS